MLNVVGVGWVFEKMAGIFGGEEMVPAFFCKRVSTPIERKKEVAKQGTRHQASGRVSGIRQGIRASGHKASGSRAHLFSIGNYFHCAL